jgi:hypothetical protein
LRASSTTAIRGCNGWEAWFNYINTNLGFYGGKLSEKKQIWGWVAEKRTRQGEQDSFLFLFLLTGSVFFTNRLNWSSVSVLKKVVTPTNKK